MRRDIQGLRALAVSLVVAQHLVGWPHGGFVGVDVFFVVSGFLITGLLLKEHELSGRISLSGFYVRRVRRILPAAVTTLAATVAVSHLVLAHARARSVTLDALFASLFSSNWRFGFAGTDYFAAAGPVSPLQNFWSLSVEEQFYFVWPWLLIMALAASSRRFATHMRARLRIAIFLTVIVAVSAAWSLMEVESRIVV